METLFKQIMPNHHPTPISSPDNFPTVKPTSLHLGRPSQLQTSRYGTISTSQHDSSYLTSIECQLVAQEQSHHHLHLYFPPVTSKLRSECFTKTAIVSLIDRGLFSKRARCNQGIIIFMGQDRLLVHPTNC